MREPGRFHATKTRCTGAQAPAREPAGTRPLDHAPKPPLKHSPDSHRGSSLPTRNRRHPGVVDRTQNRPVETAVASVKLNRGIKPPSARALGGFFCFIFFQKLTGKRAGQNQARVFCPNPGRFLTLKPARKFNTGKFTNEPQSHLQSQVLAGRNHLVRRPQTQPRPVLVSFPNGNAAPAAHHPLPGQPEITRRLYARNA